MPINVYTGLMGSGKSFECVSSVIVPAVAAGRTIVTNVDGIDGDAIRAYCHEKFGTPVDQLGNVKHCKNEDVGKADFLPHGSDVDTFCRPGDMVCIDEAWRFWGTDCKLLAEHKIFFREHRHYVHPDTHVSCDLVLMVQDISDLHRTLRVVVELSFRTTKMKSLGMAKVYRVEMWEGFKLTAKQRVSVSNKKYDPEIFPLYSSYDGGKGREMQVDSRQNILKNKGLWILAGLVVCVFSVAMFSLRWFFGGDRVRAKQASAQAAQSPVTAPGGANAAVPIPNAGLPEKARHRPFSEVWRLVGVVSINGERFVAVTDASGRLRFESPSMFRNSGVILMGDIDGDLVSWHSGQGGSGGASNVLGHVGVEARK